jgi:hypothetical protein
VTRLRAALLTMLVVAVAAIPAAQAKAPHVIADCLVTQPYAGLGPRLLALHRVYMSHRPDVHHPKIRGPEGTIHIGRCGSTRYVLASFSQTYNGLDFGETDQPEYFSAAANHGWHDHGNTGGEICGTAPPSLLLAWHIVTGCPK